MASLIITGYWLISVLCGTFALEYIVDCNVPNGLPDTSPLFLWYILIAGIRYDVLLSVSVCELKRIICTIKALNDANGCWWYATKKIAIGR